MKSFHNVIGQLNPMQGCTKTRRQRLEARGKSRFSRAELTKAYRWYFVSIN